MLLVSSVSINIVNTSPLIDGRDKITIINNDQSPISVQNSNNTANVTKSTDYLYYYTFPVKNFAPTDTLVKNNVVWISEVNHTRLTKLFLNNNSVEQIPLQKGITPLLLREDPSGNIWFSDNDYSPSNVTNYLGWINTTSEEVKYYPLPTVGAAALDMDISHNVLWFSEWRVDQIAWMNLTTHDIHEIHVPCPTKVCSQLGLRVDKNGTVWFIDYLGGFLGKYTPSTGQFKYYNFPLFSPAASKVYIDQEGYIWSGFHGGDQIVRFNPKTEKFTEYFSYKPIDGYGISGITDEIADQNHNIWFSQHLEHTIGFFDITTKTVLEYDVQRTKTAHQWLSLDSKGRIWFAEYINGIIGYIIPSKAPNVKVETLNHNLIAKKGSTIELTYTLESLTNKSLSYFPLGQVNNYYETKSRFLPSATEFTLLPGQKVTHHISLQIPLTDNANNLTLIVGFQNSLIKGETTIYIQLSNINQIISGILLFVVVGILVFVYIKYREKIKARILNLIS